MCVVPLSWPPSPHTPSCVVPLSWPPSPHTPSPLFCSPPLLASFTPLPPLCSPTLLASFTPPPPPSLLSHPEGADRVAGQLLGDKECTFSRVTKSGRVWRKVPESDAQSAAGLRHPSHTASIAFRHLPTTRRMS